MSPWSALLVSALLATGAALAAPQESRYSSLAPSDCRTLSVDQESESSTQRCPGLGGYSLLVEEGDLRQSLTVVAPGGQRSALNLWTGGFSHLGERAEWRGELRAGRFVPTALIVRLTESVDPARPERVRSSLVVAKLGATSCLSARIPPGPQMNALARAAADRAAVQPCLKRP